MQALLEVCTYAPLAADVIHARVCAFLRAFVTLAAIKRALGLLHIANFGKFIVRRRVYKKIRGHASLLRARRPAA